LKNWTEADARSALAEVDAIIASYDWSKWTSPYNLPDFEDYKLTLGYETLLRFSDQTPDSSALSWDVASLQVARYSTRTQLSKYHFESLLQTALNTNQTTPEQMGKWLESREFELEKIVLTDNLTGNGEPGWVFQVHVAESFWIKAIFALWKTPEGEYRLENIYPWTGLFWGDLNFEVGEYTGDEIPEVLIMDYFYGSGSSTWEATRVYLVEWQESQQEFVNLAKTIPVLETDEYIHVNTYLEPPKWILNPAAEQETPTIKARVEFLTPNNCPRPVYQIVYRLDQGHYLWAEEGFEGYDLSNSLFCQVVWALQTGSSDPQVLKILNRAVEDGTEDFSKAWGPAAKDYLRLQLGILYALDGQRSQAIQQLLTVRDHPERPDYHMASQLARVFLNAYPTDETFPACAKAVNYLSRAMWDQADFGMNFGNLIHSSIADIWGIDDPRWVYDVSTVCNMDAALKQSLPAANLKNTTQLIAWLNSSGIGWGPVARADIDGNGVEDWLATLTTKPDIPTWLPSRQWAVWVFLRDEQTINPVEITTFWADVPEISFEVHHLKPQGNPVGTLFAENKLSVFEIRKSQAALPLVSGLQAKPVFLMDPLYGIDTFENSSDGQGITVYNRTYNGFYSPSDTWQASYHWNETTHAYIMVEDLPSPQQQTIEEAEHALFESSQPEVAISLLQQLLAGEIRETVTSANENGLIYGPPFTSTYLQYLLGLAYELSGDEVNAVQTYWKLWHDYPESPYSLLARRKLIVSVLPDN
jgi:hypothetical protein